MNIDEIKKLVEEKTHGHGTLLFAGIVGSKAYGTDLPTSDIDVSGIYILDEDLILGDLKVRKEDEKGNVSYHSKFYEQISDDKNDATFYEIKRFLELALPTMEEFLSENNLDPKKIVYKTFKKEGTSDVKIL